jgi:hypothetical protein
MRVLKTSVNGNKAYVAAFSGKNEGVVVTAGCTVYE